MAACSRNGDALRELDTRQARATAQLTAFECVTSTVLPLSLRVASATVAKNASHAPRAQLAACKTLAGVSPQVPPPTSPRTATLVIAPNVGALGVMAEQLFKFTGVQGRSRDESEGGGRRPAPL